MFYSDTRWSHLGISLTDADVSDYEMYEMGDLSSLVAWHYLDPPDDFERRRNHTIYSQELNPQYYTNNRNAFVDHPEFVWSVYAGQENDSRLSIDGATVFDDGTSVLDLQFDPIIVGAPSQAARSVALRKTGQDGTYYQVAADGEAFCNLEGRFNAFRSDGPDGVTFDVGLSADSMTAGLYGGRVLIDNLDVTTEGGLGRGANDGNDVINLNISILDHATPSFADDGLLSNWICDFGTAPRGTAVRSCAFDVFNLATTVGFTASLELDSVLGSGNTSTLKTDLTPLLSSEAIDAGSGGRSFTATMDTSASGTFSATYTLSFSDEDLLGGSSLPDLLLTLKGAVEVVDLLRGDFNGNGVLDAGDIEMLVGDAQEPSLDLTGDGVITQDDRVYWVHDLALTWFGDAGLDGEFNSGDFVQVFVAGKYETNGLASWSEGDWNGDGFFDSADFITAFTDGGYEQGPRTDVAAVPEPGGVVLLLLGVVSVMRRRRAARRSIPVTGCTVRASHRHLPLRQRRGWLGK